ncbi:MAG: bifunctional oligoribonuclease/PAP phosphatase NrnA [Halobacteriaceae archaeon]
MVFAVAGVTVETAVVALAVVLIAGAGGYAAYTVRERRRPEAEEGALSALRSQLTNLGDVALVVPENPSIDALAAAIGLQALVREWGLSATLYAQGEVTAEDAVAFCNIFEISPVVLEDGRRALSDERGVVVIGGGGPVPTFATVPVVAVVRHRPVTAEDAVVATGSDDGATSTTATHLLKDAGVIPEQRVATALLYGIRAGTQEFRRVRSQSDYEAASYLHAHADQGRIEALRAPGMSGETFDVIGEAIANRERRESFAVSNVGTVPSIGAIEEAADTLLRLDGVSSAAVFGVYEDAVVAACRSEDVRTNAEAVLEGAFVDADMIGGTADAATARTPLGLFSQVEDTNQGTLDELIDASTRTALFEAYEAS